MYKPKNTKKNLLYEKTLETKTSKKKIFYKAIQIFNAIHNFLYKA